MFASQWLAALADRTGHGDRCRELIAVSRPPESSALGQQMHGLQLHTSRDLLAYLNRGLLGQHRQTTISTPTQSERKGEGAMEFRHYFDESSERAGERDKGRRLRDCKGRPQPLRGGWWLVNLWMVP
jgi:hypothetical protein